MTFYRNDVFSTITRALGEFYRIAKPYKKLRHEFLEKTTIYSSKILWKFTESLNQRPVDIRGNLDDRLSNRFCIKIERCLKEG